MITSENAPSDHDLRDGPLQRVGVVGVVGQLGGDELGHEVAVAGDGALEHARLLHQRLGVDEVPVVAESEHVVVDRPVGRLGVAPGRRAGGRVAAVADGQVAVEAGQSAVVEHAGHQALVLDDRELLAIADGHAGRLLAAVLEGEEAEIGELGDGLVGRPPRGVEADDAARLLEVVVAVRHGPQSAVPTTPIGEPVPDVLYAAPSCLSTCSRPRSGSWRSTRRRRWWP
jgi:hypothetical protein